MFQFGHDAVIQHAQTQQHIDDDQGHHCQIKNHRPAEEAHGAPPKSALIPAVEKGYVEIVEMLHHAGARLPQEHLLPLAVKAGNPAMVEYLAKFGCSPTAGLGGAVERGDIEMTRLLLDMDAVPGGFELRAAAQHGYAEILKLILPLAQAEINADVKYTNRSVKSSVIGVTPEFYDILNYKISEGEFIGDVHYDGKQKVCVLGAGIAFTLFQKEEPIGKMINSSPVV